jgi:hypothetical protein
LAFDGSVTRAQEACFQENPSRLAPDQGIEGERVRIVELTVLERAELANTTGVQGQGGVFGYQGAPGQQSACPDTRLTTLIAGKQFLSVQPEKQGGRVSVGRTQSYEHEQTDQGKPLSSAG